MAQTIVSRYAIHPAGKCINNVNPRGLFVHALSVFRSPKKGTANAYESLFLIRKPSKGFAWNL